MTLTAEQQKKVEENLGLVGKVLKDKVHGLPQHGVYTYDDLFQIGCIGLCKAAATDKGGTFSTYAYRLIWNEICDALIKATRIAGREETMDMQSAIVSFHSERSTPSIDMNLSPILAKIEGQTDGMVAKGIRALRLSLAGYTSQEIGHMLNAQPGAVRMWMTKARRHLQKRTELRLMMEYIE
ncbi:MAG: sigma-70 family RNA polymerase sigma factor [Acetatifactor sp.]